MEFVTNILLTLLAEIYHLKEITGFSFNCKIKSVDRCPLGTTTNGNEEIFV